MTFRVSFAFFTSSDNAILSPCHARSHISLYRYFGLFLTAIQDQDEQLPTIPSDVDLEPLHLKRPCKAKASPDTGDCVRRDLDLPFNNILTNNVLDYKL